MIKLTAKGIEGPRAKAGKSVFVRVLQFDGVTRVDLHRGFAAGKFIRLAIRKRAGVTFTVAKIHRRSFRRTHFVSTNAGLVIKSSRSEMQRSRFENDATYIHLPLD